MIQITAENQTLLEKQYRAALTGVIVQFGLTVLLMAAAWIVPMRSGKEISASTFTTVWSLILFVALGAFLLRRILFKWEKLKNIAVLKGVGGVLAALRNYAYFLGLLGLLTAIAGFVLTYLIGDPWQMTRAGLVAAVVFAAGFPRKTIWQKIVANLEKSDNTFLA